ncbi:hypothetical protein T552_00524 [Pneumocystis carinii B80]|uniref:Serine/threonine-protein kinase TOR n=1 Tax=Pneumocystis carinii (strain B80) TaxID=1408658 RepID=A0A0W4ZR21_PNEC8|nr:hypothetical protein T552_00524 [Pneumocystis carinii B80]KTW30812.1 hypothetical protein T552_00524 [Pneumocystis carinii B80]
MPTYSSKLDKLFSDLKNRNEEIRNKIANDLKEYVVSTSREMQRDAFISFNNDINRRIYELVHSNDSYERLSGVIVIDKLIDYDGEENTVKITRFANYLRIVLPGNDTQIMILASKALGRLAVPGGTLTSEFVEFEVKRAMEWLQGDRNENRRLAAVLVLKELALNSPTLIYSYVSQIFDLIWVALRESKVTTRNFAADALSACLEIIYQRESQLCIQWYVKILEEAQYGLKVNNYDYIHGSLLAYKELLLKSGTFMHDKYVDVCEVVLSYKDHKEALIRRTVVSLIPILAGYNSEKFVSSYLHKSMLHLLGQLKKNRDRTSPFAAIGHIAVAVGNNIEPYLDSILEIIKEGLTAKGRNREAQEAPIFQCISMLAIAVGNSLTKYLHQLLDMMFCCGLSEPLRQALVDLTCHIPSFFPIIQERLLNLLSMILSGKPFKVLGSPATSHSTQSNSLAIYDPKIYDNKDSEFIILALNTLRTFDFSGYALNEFIRDCAISYLESDNLEVRKMAALTCCQLFIRDPICYQTSSHAIQMVGEILEKLLIVGITDSDPMIRQIVLSSLDERFDRHLAQAENVRSLFIALNDEVFAIREITITIIGRLTFHNPAYVMPSLRKTLIQLLTELEYSYISRNKEENACLLGLLFSTAKRLIKPYVKPMLKIMIQKARDPSPGVVSSILNALGELAVVGGEDIIPYIPDLMPLIIEILQDQSSAVKRDAALRTLGRLAISSGYIIDPYIEYPSLFNILINILKTEQSSTVRKETVKVIGILGALDPYKYQMLEETSEDHIHEQKAATSDVSLLIEGMSPSSEEYYPTVVINILMTILKDSSLSTYHYSVIQAIMYVFKTLGLKCVPFLPQIIPGFLSVMQICLSSLLEFYFQQLSILVTIVKQHIRNYLSDIFKLIYDYWNSNSTLQITILSLVESIVMALEGEFKAYLPTLLSLMLQVLETDTTDNRQSTQEILRSFVVFGSNIEEYIHLILPVVVKMFERHDLPVSLRKIAIQTVAQLSRKINFVNHASRIIHPLARVLSTGIHELKVASMDTLCALVFQLGLDYTIFIPMINKCLINNHIQHQNYELLVSRLLKGESLPQDLNSDEKFCDRRIEDASSADINAKKLSVNQQHLKNAWETSQKSTKDDWQEWIRRLSVELLKESPSHALRACASLAAVYYPLSRELFNVAFLSCWNELSDHYQEELVRSIEIALASPNIPAETLQNLLNLAEFMEHDDKTLPIDIRTLGAYAAKCHAFAKALHYKELEFISEPSTDTIEALISINNHLQQPDAAIGILSYAQQHNLELKETWYEKLERWEDALATYEKRSIEDNSFEVTMGKMRCLHALGEWELLSQLARERWETATNDMRRSISPLAAAAAWGLGQWELMDDYISSMKHESLDKSFFKAIISLHRNQFNETVFHISKARELLDTEFTALIGESYNRAYYVAVRVQMLAELEEIIIYKQNNEHPEIQSTMRKTWMKRLNGCQRNVEVWQRMLKMKALVISPKENMEMWIKFSNLCRKSGRLGLAEKSLNSLLDTNESIGDLPSSTNVPPKVVYTHLKYMWETDDKHEALERLKEFSNSLSKDLKITSINETFQSLSLDQEKKTSYNDYSKLLSRCYHKQGEWQSVLQGNLTKTNISEILHSYKLATEYDPEYYKAWHSWALANFEVVAFYEKENKNLSPEIYDEHILPAIKGFFRSIALSTGNSLQDTLRLLNLWFKFGNHLQVGSSILEGIASVSIDTWLDVIPQLIARIHSPNSNIQKSIHQLLADVGKSHPQALVYPLTVASKSQNISRQKSALEIIDKIRNHSALLVEQALLVSHELIRVAILWHEQWHEGLEEASRLYFGDHNIEAMFNILEPLHEMLERGPETLREISFHQAFGRDLQEAREWCIKYRKTGEIGDLNQAWDLYYQVFRKITKQLPQLTTLELQYVSPKILSAVDLELAVPGTYVSKKPIIRIISFSSTFTVITSKQRPRRLTIRGSDGKDYQYVLKGHEDIRQDERVMQLFGLVNTLLSVDSESFKRHLNIQRYPVIPLSPNSGLLGWVPDSDTLHVLIKDYRESRKILLNIEHRLMLQMAPDYDNLTLLQKVEVFEYALDNTTGQDLYRVLWLKSKNSEVWLDRRTNYTRSLAVMSMVGYILGLGDRHPSNIMLDRHTGKAIHIDFGDCFEVAMNREKFPEKIPFRLTRMLTNAMEVSGIEGSFRITCEHVMRVLRDNKESLMALLEAFVYDPLVNWKLINTNPNVATHRNEQNESSKIPAKQNQENESTWKAQYRYEISNQSAVNVLNRVSNKLTGRDFKLNQELDIPSQVNRLIQQATSLENLSQCYIGWCSFW